MYGLMLIGFYSGAILFTVAAIQRFPRPPGCAGIYKTTADKKVSDLTVKEAQQVQACQALGLYPPQ